MVTASPELAVRGPVSTATQEDSRSFKVEGGSTPTAWPAIHDGPGPSGLTKVPRPAFPRNGLRPASIGHMLPPVSGRRSTTQPQDTEAIVLESASCMRVV